MTSTTITVAHIYTAGSRGAEMRDEVIGIGIGWITNSQWGTYQPGSMLETHPLPK
jgi:hypothetical protein